MKTIDTGNETVSIGVVADGDGFLALTLTKSKNFKTFQGAERWLKARGYTPDGKRLS